MDASIFLKAADNLRLPWAHVDQDLRFTSVSESYAKMVAMDVSDLTGQSIAEVLGEKASSKLLSNWRKALAAEVVSLDESIGIELGHRKIELLPTYIPSQASKNESLDDKPQDSGFYVFIRDVSDSRKVIDTLRELHAITSDTRVEIDAKIQKLLRLGKEIFDLPLAIVSRISGEKYKVKYSDTPNEEVKPGDEFDLGKTYCLHTLLADGPIAFDHAGESEIGAHPCYASFGLESYIGVPLRVSGNRYGTLNFSGPEIHSKPFSVDDLELIRLFAQWIGNELTRSKFERDLIRHQDMLESMGSLARIGAWEVDLVRETVVWSNMTREIHEVDEDFEPTMEQGIDFYKEGESRNQIELAVNDAIKHGTPWNLELQIVTAKGNEIWVAALGNAEFKDGKCVRLYGSFQDIDKRVKADLELKKAIETSASQALRMKLANDSAGIGVWEWDLESNELIWDEWMYRLYGVSEGLFSGVYDAWVQSVHPDDLGYAQSQLQKAIAGQGTYDPEFRIVRPDGETRWIKASAEVHRDASGKATKITGVNYDVTERVRALEHLESAKVEAERAAEAKSNFLANMSHEIRTPMNGVIGMLQVLKGSDLNQQQGEQLDIAIRSAESLLVVINDILDVSKIDAGKLEVESIEFNLRDQIHDVLKVLSHTMPADSEVVLSSDLSGIEDPNVIGDPVRIRQIISNLVNNAIKFTSKGEIELKAELEHLSGRHLRFKCSVEDTGIGIAADDVDGLFDEFSQADSSTTRKFGGTGLGLSISRRLCELMGGHITVTSKVGQGSCFYFEIDLLSGVEQEQKQQTENEALEQETGFSGQKVLLVEDNTVNQVVANYMLGHMGLKIDICSNGKEAIEALKSDEYALILMDCQMPEMDGYEATLRIRRGEAGVQYKEHPIVALTANAMEGDKERCMSAGMNDYLAKPLEERALRNTLAKWLH